ncbi:MAG TPA: ABC transporter permease [Bryobacteraceae bacterium]
MRLRWRKDSEFDEEIQAHLDLETQANLGRGMPAEEARAAALRKFGNTTRVKERAREADPLFWLGTIFRDLRHGLRSLARNPGFAAVAVLSLGLGIGANCAIFSFVDGLLLRPLDVPRPGDVVLVNASSPQYRFGSFSYAEYSTYRDQNRTLAGLLTQEENAFAIQSDGAQARNVYGKLISGNFFDVLQIRPSLGRTFRPEDDSPATKEIAVVISDECWQDKFHSDARAVGAQIKLNAQPATVIGILPHGFRGPGFLPPEVYATLAATPRLFAGNALLTDPKARELRLLGRLKRGASVRQAQTEFAGISQRVERVFPKADRLRTATVLPELTGRLQEDPDNLQSVTVNLIVAAIVLLIACTNVANLLLGRAAARVKEMTIRQSVGAGRGRLIAQLMTESAALALLGAGAGLLLAQVAIKLIASVRIAADIPGGFPARMDLRVVFYGLAASAVGVILFGLWPAIRATRADLVSPTKDAAPSRSRVPLRNAVVTVQTALAAMLLICASLFLKSFFLARRADPGFRVDNVLTASFDPSLVGYSEERTRAFYDNLRTRAAAIPGVREVTMGSHLPMGITSQWTSVSQMGTPTVEPMFVMYDCVEPGYFTTMATTIIEGRAFGDRDRAGAPGVAIVNRELARRWWPDVGVIGKRIQFGVGKRATVVEVVGIARDGKYQAATDLPAPYIYLPYPQQFRSSMTLFVHTAGDPLSVAPVLRQELQSIGPDVPAYIHTMRETFDEHGLLPSRLHAQIVGAMGMIGLALAVAGLYAVAAFAVARRTREIGIRMALGASSVVVLKGVLADGVKLAAVGGVLGAAGALALTRYLREFLDQVSPQDPIAFWGVSILMLAVALAACWIPARRASRVDPAIILRYE